jgi:hypothetical protein
VGSMRKESPKQPSRWFNERRKKSKATSRLKQTRASPLGRNPPNPL